MDSGRGYNRIQEGKLGALEGKLVDTKQGGFSGPTGCILAKRFGTLVRFMGSSGHWRGRFLS